MKLPQDAHDPMGMAAPHTRRLTSTAIHSPGRIYQLGSVGGDRRKIRSREREAREAAARRDAASGVSKWSEAGPRRRRPAAGSGQGRAPPPGGAALPPGPSTARFAVPAARELEAGPAPWACARLARGLPGRPRNRSPGARRPS